MEYLIEGELVDTYGGDYTYRDVWYEIENGEYTFYERCYGAKPSEAEVITDKDEIEEFLSDIRTRELIANDEETMELLRQINEM